MGDSVAEPSPSRFTYCYSLECSVRIESTSTEEKKPTLTAKNATITLGRNASRQILLQVELNGGKSRYYPAFASYSLADCIVHQQGIGHGKGSIEIPSRKMVVQLSNCAPRRLNVFLKSLQAKIDIMNAECKSNSNTLCTPISVKRQVMASDDQPSKHTIQLSDEQRAVIRAAVQSKQNLFFTGSAGTGKSLILRRIIELLPASTTFITAATGVAACHLGGVTLHSFAGIGVGGLSTKQSLRIANSKKNIIKQWRMCSHLIIDEISMVDAEYFTNIEYRNNKFHQVARSIRGDNRPFGGIQLIITGDFLQLPPVVKNTEELKFCFESPAWNRSIQKIIILEQVQRQTDRKFISILQQIRMGRCNQEAIDCLVRTKDNNLISEGIVPTRLCTHTADADKLNC
uniref:ATP-dependent DNA helicase n=1 Tax=Heterorhabditis bacteriophora TaxID=37862 RepID=A0A1I7XAU8_HETBA